MTLSNFAKPPRRRRQRQGDLWIWSLMLITGTVVVLCSIAAHGCSHQ